MVPWASLKRAAHSLYTGAGNVAPAPLMVPPFWAPELLALLEEPLGLLSSLPQAAMPAASSAVQPTARTFVERKGVLLVVDGVEARIGCRSACCRAVTVV